MEELPLSDWDKNQPLENSNQRIWKINWQIVPPRVQVGILKYTNCRVPVPVRTKVLELVAGISLESAGCIKLPLRTKILFVAAIFLGIFFLTCRGGFFCNHFDKLYLFKLQLITNNAPLTYVYPNIIETCLTTNHLLFGRQLLYFLTQHQLYLRN